jgi:hypothetical protein
MRETRNPPFGAGKFLVSHELVSAIAGTAPVIRTTNAAAT